MSYESQPGYAPAGGMRETGGTLAECAGRKYDVEDDVGAIYEEATDVAYAGVDSLKNTVQAMNQAKDSSKNTLQNITTQNERLKHTDDVMNQALEEMEDADDNIKTLEAANKGMFSPSWCCFRGRKASKAAESDQRRLQQRQMNRLQSEKSRQMLADAQTEMKKNSLPSTRLAAAGPADTVSSSAALSLPEEAPEALGQALSEQDNYLDVLLQGVGELKQDSQAMHAGLTAGNTLVDSIHGKANRVDDKIEANKLKLGRIR